MIYFDLAEEFERIGRRDEDVVFEAGEDRWHSHFCLNFLYHIKPFKTSRDRKANNRYRQVTILKF